MKHKMAYTTDGASTRLLLNRLSHKISQTTNLNPHPGLIIASHHFSEPYPLVNDIDLLCLAVMDLLIQFPYPSLSGYGKFTIAFTMKRSYGEEITFTLGNAIPLTTQDCQFIPKSEVLAHISQDLKKYAEIYDGECVVRVSIRVYMEGQKMMDRLPLSSEERDSSLSEIMEAGLSEIDPITAREIRNNSKRRYPTHITALKQSSTELKPFMVADIETILNDDNVHQPYAAGILLVRPGEDLSSKMVCIDTYFSEDYRIILDDFKDRSTKVLYDLVLRIETIARQEPETVTIYFHNFSRFDGIFVLKHLICHHKSYKLKPMMRNNKLYELAVYSGNKMLFRFRDSLLLLPGKLSDLAQNLCPGLGPKGSIPYDEITLSNLTSLQKRLLDYMKQDILLLGGVMQKAQDIYWKQYKVDIESKITHSALALTIFRMKYYDESNWPIHIPNKNEDSFIRRGYYGGHTDAYKPLGEDLYYYDVNSLYPFVMKEFPMPGGVPVWHGNLEGKDLDSICGFIEAYVVCPKTIRKPFLPYRDKNDTLIFPTGEFVGVYYSEELKFAKSLGYTVIPIEGYLFERMESPCRDFVSSLFESRLEARKSGNEALAYVFKILMNSLYGRFGINPKSTKSDICGEDQYKHLLRHSEFLFGEMLCENKYIVAYRINTGKDTENWNPPKNSAVQLAAAITASARIYMYPYISREDCYYTDTDSVVLGQPLSEEVISSSVLGKFKLEDRVIHGLFLAPKAYCYTAMDGNNVLKYKGPAKNMVTPEWFEKQYADPSRTELVPVKANFRIDWHQLNITKKETWVRLGIKLGTKRNAVYHEDVWVDTDPIDITDLSCLDNIGKLIIKSLRNNVIQLQDEKTILLSRLAERERELAEKGVDGYKENAMILDQKRSLPVSQKDTPKPESKWIKETEALKKEEQNPLSSTKGKGTGQTKPQKKPP